MPGDTPLILELQKLGEDKDFQDDLNQQIVQDAILHWIGRKRLSPEEADERFMENYRVVAVLQKFLRIQELCKRENAPFPIDLFLKGQESSRVEDEKVVEASVQQPAVTWSVSSSESSSIEREEEIDQPQGTEEEEEKKEEEEEDSLANYGVLGKLLSMKGDNVARWWSIQFALIAALFAHLLTAPSSPSS